MHFYSVFEFWETEFMHFYVDNCSSFFFHAFLRDIWPIGKQDLCIFCVVFDTGVAESMHFYVPFCTWGAFFDQQFEKKNDFYVENSSSIFSMHFYMFFDTWRNKSMHFYVDNSSSFFF